MKLLCVADVHLGRAPARLHHELGERAADLGPAEAWRRAVKVALAEQVDAVLLAGDLIDGGNDFFEAFADLRDGVRHLTDAGVQVVAVAGNHDPEVLTRLVQVVPQVRLLGAGGRWEAVDLASRDGTGSTVRVVGWSFPARWVDESPLAGAGLAEALEGRESAETQQRSRSGDGFSAGSPYVVTLGLLHADRDQAGSRYAPVTSAELAAAPVDAWLLGHVHHPDFELARRGGVGGGVGGAGFRGGYLGSLSSNDPAEAGARGAWLLEVDAAGGLECRHVALAPLRWERLQIDVTELQQPADVQTAVISSLEQLGVRLEEEGADPVAVGCRLVLSGRTPYRAQIEALLEADPPGARLIPIAGLDFFVDQVLLEALPAVDLDVLAMKDDPVGLVAARVLALADPESPVRGRLIEAAEPGLAELGGRSDYSGAPEPYLKEDEVAALLRSAALNALDALLAQGAPDGTREGVTRGADEMRQEEAP